MNHLFFALTSPLLEYLAGRGIDIDEVWRRAALPPREEGALRSRLPTAQFFGFWEAVEALATTRDLGLCIGAGTGDGCGFSVASTAARHAADFGAAMRTLARYKRLTCPEILEIETARGEVAIRCNWFLAEEAVPRLLVDSAFSTFLALARNGDRNAVPLRVELARVKRDATLYRQHFGCEIRFGAPFDRIVFDEKLLAIPFRTHDGDALARLVPGLEAALAEHAKEGSFRADVRLAIARQMTSGDRPSIDKVARRLGASSRTLQRRLGEEHTSYQQELDEVRQQTARRLLSVTELDPVDVAFLLGFEEPNSFTRAFRTWEGVTPREWRTDAGTPRAQRSRARA